MPDKDPWDLGGGGESFQFERIGDSVEGYVQDMIERQGNDMQTGEPEYWDKEKTRPVMITLVTLQTNLREMPNDTGLRMITLSGSKKPNPDGTKSRMCAARDAVLLATGRTAMAYNGWLKLTFTSEGARTKPGFNPPKYYAAEYRPPAMDLDGTSATANTAAQQSSGPEWAQPDAAENPQNWVGTGGGGSVASAASITKAQVEAVSAAGMDPAQVFGADWESRVTP